jgi:shikimate kinase
MNRLILIGPRSVGKTTIGKALSLKLKIEFFDLDDIVDKDLHGLDLYIQKNGVKAYRCAEHDILKKFVSKLPKEFVLAVGGGTIASQYKTLSRQNAKILKSAGLIIYLCPSKSKKESINILYKNELKRKGNKSRAETEKLYDLRLSIYEGICDTKVLIKNKSVSRILKEIIP